ncbi:MAG: glycosyltransferase family 4 protein [Candidatus Aminicenantes bacterium]|nr:glycosyltransferase family 4 protein [Candidatus Aminicenantes bacterium]
MKVAFIGQKGMPPVFGGVEVHVDALSRGLVRSGVEAVVYVRNWYTPRRLKSHGGVRLIHAPTIRTKHLDAAVHGFFATVHCLFTKADIVHYHGIGPAAFSPLARLSGRRVVVTVHRLDWAADKWGGPARMMLKLAERLAARSAHAVAAVSADTARYLSDRYGIEAAVIPNAVPPAGRRPLSEMGPRFGLEARKYLLFLGRLVPEKRPDWLIRAFLEIADRSGGMKLVLAGGASGTEDYVRRLRNAARGDPRIVFTGNVTGTDKEELMSNALLFVLPSRLEGHPIALLEARGYGLGCLASDIDAHREVVADGVDGILFRADDYREFAAALRKLLGDPERIRELGRKALEAEASRPGWEDVVTRTLRLYRSLAARLPKPGGLFPFLHS